MRGWFTGMSTAKQPLKIAFNGERTENYDAEHYCTIEESRIDTELLLPDWNEVFWPCEFIMMWFSEVQMDISDESQMKEHERTLSCPLHVLSSFGLGLCANFRHSTDHLWSSLISLSSSSSLPSLSSCLCSARRSMVQGTLSDSPRNWPSAASWSRKWLQKSGPLGRMSNVAAHGRMLQQITAMCNRLAVSGFQLRSICRALRVLVGYGARSDSVRRCLKGNRNILNCVFPWNPMEGLLFASICQLSWTLYITTQASLVQSGGAQGATLIALNPKDTMTNSKLQIVSTCFNMFQHVSTCFNMFQIQKSLTALSACDVCFRMLHICLLSCHILSHLVTSGHIWSHFSWPWLSRLSRLSLT